MPARPARPAPWRCRIRPQASTSFPFCRCRVPLWCSGRGKDMFLLASSSDKLQRLLCPHFWPAGPRLLQVQTQDASRGRLTMGAGPILAQSGPVHWDIEIVWMLTAASSVSLMERLVQCPSVPPIRYPFRPSKPSWGFLQPSPATTASILVWEASRCQGLACHDPQALLPVTGPLFSCPVPQSLLFSTHTAYIPTW